MVTQMITQTARRILIFAFTITVLAQVSGCSTKPPVRAVQERGPVTVTRSQSFGERAAAVALQQVGVPYRYGGATRSGFDCSGLVQYSYGQAGKRLPRTTGQLWSASEAVSSNELQAGDLLFFDIAGKMSHVGLYLGDGRFVHAPSTGRTVAVASLTAPFYRAAFIRGGRPR